MGSDIRDRKDHPMGLLDKAKKLFKANEEKIDDAVDEHGEQIAEGVDKATDVVDDKTGGKFHDQLEQVDEAARDKLTD